ncbi:MAG: sulfatase-like hydrolase/transferase [bacterium]|nr:sulfatase-like hydrolase/transferase [bacterium]
MAFISRNKATGAPMQHPVPYPWQFMRSLLLLSALLGLLVHARPCLAAVSAERPNILFIIADDASRDSFGAYGSTYVNTPNFDRIAREGVRFTQAYNCNPKCAPARACILTGRYSWQLEEACNHNPFLSDKWKFYPFLLEEAGYAIGYTGKGWGPGIHAGIDAGKSKFQNVNPAGRPYQSATLKPPYQGISNADYGQNLDDFLDQKPVDQPFCFWLGTREPHRGYEKDSWKKQGRDLQRVTVPEYYPDNETIRGDLADYAIEVEWFDRWIGHALDSLESRGLLEDTLILVTSDHGMPFPRVKGQIYDDGFHVPMAARWGAKIPSGRVVSDFVTFPDIAPTLLELAGLEPHAQMTGKSFVQQLLSDRSGRIDPQRDHTLLGKERHDIGRTDGDLLSVGYPSRALRNDHYLYVRNFKPDRWPVGNPEYDFPNCDGSPTKSYLTGLSQLDPDYRYFELSFGKRAEEELYDMEKDPDCVHNLAGSREHQLLKLQLWEQLKRELAEQGDPRILGQGDIFDFYPNCRIDRQQQLYARPDYDPVQIFEQRYNVVEPNGQDPGKQAGLHDRSSPAVGAVQGEGNLRLVETAETISILRGNVLILAYNKQPPTLPTGIDPVYRQSGFLHPVNTPQAVTVSAVYPEDHPHQNGIFSAWVRTKFRGHSIDFWNLADRSGKVLHESVISKSSPDAILPEFSVSRLHRAFLPVEGSPATDGTASSIAVDVLRETWNIRMLEANDESNCFEIEMMQEALTDDPLTIEEYHYGGSAVRGPVDWLVAQAGDRSVSYMLNSAGSDRVQGNHENVHWVALSGQINGRPRTITVMSHADNFRDPQAARLHPTKPYFCFAPCVDGEFIIDKDKPFRSRYLYVVTDDHPNPEWLGRQWKNWTQGN